MFKSINVPLDPQFEKDMLFQKKLIILCEKISKNEKLGDSAYFLRNLRNSKKSGSLSNRKIKIINECINAYNLQYDILYKNSGE